MTVFELGSYPQGPAGDPAVLRWVVLNRCGDDTVLAVTEQIVDCRRWHDAAAPSAVTTWQDCTLRGWLNGPFLETAFTGAERDLLRLADCTDNGPGTPDTTDRVFLLSVAEVRRLTQTTVGGPLVDRRTVGTAYAQVAKPDGSRLYVYDKTVEKDYLQVDGARRGCSWWWTRSQPQARDGAGPTAAFVGARGDVKSYGKVGQSRCGVRPAIRCAVQLQH